MRAKQLCSEPTCSNLVEKGRCFEHARPAWERSKKAKPSDYGADYQRIRRQRFDPKSEHYEDACHICGGPGLEDDALDHVRTREATLENLHRAHERCNRLKAASAGGRA